jgi:hypothetical protein
MYGRDKDMIYDVWLSGTQYATVTVDASSKLEALKLAREEAEVVGEVIWQKRDIACIEAVERKKKR